MKFPSQRYCSVFRARHLADECQVSTPWAGCSGGGIKHVTINRRRSGESPTQRSDLRIETRQIAEADLPINGHTSFRAVET